MRTQKWILFFGVVMLMFNMLSSTMAAEKTIKIKWASVLAPTDLNNIVAAEVIKRVKERTQGVIELTLYPSSQLGKAHEVFQQQKLGAAILAETVPSWSADLGYPTLQILDGPFLYENVEQLNRFLKSDLAAKWNAEFLKRSGIRILTWNWYGGQRHILGKRGFKHPDDLKGVKFRVPETPVWIRTFELLGATPTIIPWAEVYNALSMGVADAAESPLSAIWSIKLYEVAKVITLTGHFTAVRGFQINEQLFQSIPPEHQKVLIEEFIRGGEQVTKMALQSEDEFIKKMSEKGVSFIKPEVHLYKQRTKPFYTEEKAKWTSADYNELLAVLQGK
ncbi:MAG: TRAP transporter substrate-binding protein DctP [Candidatus Methanomethylicaceae archaeon]